MNLNQLKKSIERENGIDVYLDLVSSKKNVIDCYCPICEVMLVFVNQHYCHNYGQKLSWKKYFEMRLK